MDTEMAESLKKMTEVVNANTAQWEKVREIAKDIIAWIRRDPRRFGIEVSVAVGTKMIRVYLRGAERYRAYGEQANDMTLRQLFDHFFEDHEALVSMVEKLAEAVIEATNIEIEKNSS
jgi:hypothetical protein